MGCGIGHCQRCVGVRLFISIPVSFFKPFIVDMPIAPKRKQLV